MLIFLCKYSCKIYQDMNNSLFSAYAYMHVTRKHDAYFLGEFCRRFAIVESATLQTRETMLRNATRRLGDTQVHMATSTGIHTAQ